MLRAIRTFVAILATTSVENYNNSMLDKILGSKTAQKIFLHLFHYGETYPSAVAKDFQISLGQVQRQFDRFEEAGIIISKLSGRTRIYQF